MHKILFVSYLLVISLSTVSHADVASLCQSNENTVWSCQTRTKIYSVCASQNLSERTGYLQYRAGTTQHIEFHFPSALLHPKDYFEFDLLRRGAAFSFQNGDYGYFIIEDLSGDTIIEVTKSNNLIANIQCIDSTGNLTENKTIDFFSSIKISR